MKRYAVGMALGLLLAGFGHADAQSAGRVARRDGGRVEVRRAPVAVWAPGRVVVPGARVVVAAGLGVRSRDVLGRDDLRRLVGRDAVRTLERHARTLDARGPMEGRWYRSDRRTALLEVTVGGDLVAEFVDHGADGTLDRLHLAEVPVDRYRHR